MVSVILRPRAFLAMVVAELLASLTFCLHICDTLASFASNFAPPVAIAANQSVGLFLFNISWAFVGCLSTMLPLKQGFVGTIFLKLFGAFKLIAICRRVLRRRRTVAMTIVYTSFERFVGASATNPSSTIPLALAVKIPFAVATVSSATTRVAVRCCSQLGDMHVVAMRVLQQSHTLWVVGIAVVGLPHNAREIARRCNFCNANCDQDAHDCRRTEGCVRKK